MCHCRASSNSQPRSRSPGGKTPERPQRRRGRGKGPWRSARDILSPGGGDSFEPASPLPRAAQQEARRHFSKRARRGSPGLQRRPAPSLSSGANTGGRRRTRSSRSLPPAMTSPSVSRSPHWNGLLPLERTDARGAWPRLPPRSPRLVRTGRSADGRRASLPSGRSVGGRRAERLGRPGLEGEESLGLY
ncbi:uncharacterized protein PHA67_011222 isoform 1-T4 [Liasis olivaceus]